jgi:hypothetical protein
MLTEHSASAVLTPTEKTSAVLMPTYKSFLYFSYYFT